MPDKRRVTSIRGGLGRRGAGRPRKPLTVEQAVELNDPQAEVVALKRRIAAAMGDASPRDLAPLARQLLRINAELAGLDAAAEEAQPVAAGGADAFDPDAI
jgi:hypothetical protein